MHPTTMMEDHKTFDDFLKGILFAELDVGFVGTTTNAEAMHLVDADVEEATARVVFAGPIKVVEPVESPTSVDSPMHRLRRRKVTPLTGRLSATAQRRRDRRRNKGQRERENAKRKIKQAHFLKRREACFRNEFVLRDAISRILSSVMEDRNVGVQAAIALLPDDVRHVIACADTTMRRYRNFTGQKHIAEQLNSFPLWAAGEN